MGFGLMIGFIGLFDTASDYTTILCYTHTGVYCLVFTSHCSVMASNSGHSPSCEFAKCPRPAVYSPLPSNGRGVVGCSSIVA
jgi:hypothetical protein